MKKLFGIMVLMIFVVGLIPGIVLAKQEGAGWEDTDDSEEDSNGMGLENQERERVQIANTGELPQLANRERVLEKAQERISNILSKISGNKAREITQAKFENAKEKYAKAQEKFQNAKEKYEAAQLRWEEAKQKRLECEGECVLEETELLENVKEYVRESAERMVAHLEKVKETVDSNDALTEEEAAEILASIDEEIANINAIKETIDGAETREQLREMAREINQAWSRIRAQERYAVNQNAQVGLRNLMLSLAESGEEITATIEESKADGEELGDAETYLEEFNTKMDAAELLYESVVAKLDEAKSLEGNDKVTALEEARDLFHQMRDDLKDAHTALKNIYKELKANGIDIS